MKILFFGDSLTKGQVGASFLHVLTQKYPTSQLVNCGTNGDTWNVISQKLLEHLQRVNNYDFIVLQGGGNDLLLPIFEARGGLFEFAYRSQLKKGLVPVETSTQYGEALEETFRKIKTLYSGKVIFVTMSCLNETLDTDLNRHRRAFNKAAKRTVAQEGFLLADIEPLFDRFLAKKMQADYLIEKFWAVTITDRIVSFFKNGPAQLSKRRGLYLTIDGAHVNTWGAGFIGECIISLIEEERGKRDKSLNNLHKKIAD